MPRPRGRPPKPRDEEEFEEGDIIAPAPTRAEAMGAEVNKEWREYLRKHKEITEHFRKKFIELFRDMPKKSKELSDVDRHIAVGKHELAGHLLHKLNHEAYTIFITILNEVELEKEIRPEHNPLRKKLEDFHKVLEEFNLQYNQYRKALYRKASGCEFGFYRRQQIFFDYVSNNYYKLKELPTMVFLKTTVFSGLFVERESAEQEVISFGKSTEKEISE